MDLRGWAFFFFKEKPGYPKVWFGRGKKAESSQWTKRGCESPTGPAQKEGWTYDKKEQYIKTKDDIDFSFFLILLKPHPENWILTNSQYLLIASAY